MVLLTYVLLSLFSFRLIFSNGCIAIHDLAPLHKFSQLYRPFEYPWDHLSNLGIPTFLTGNMVYNVAWIILSLATGSAVLAHKLLLCLLLASAGYGFFLVFPTLIKPTGSKVGAFVAGISYMYNPWSLDRIIYGHNTIFLGYAILPYALLLYLKGLKNVNIKHVLACGLLSSLLFLTSPHMAYFFFVLIFFHSLFNVITAKRESLKRKLTRHVTLIISILALNIAFSFPVLYHTYKIDIPLYVVREEETAYYAINLSSLTLTDVLYIFFGASLVCWGAIRFRKEESSTHFLFLSLCGLGLLLACGGLWPMTPVYTFLFNYAPGFFIFTEANRFLFFPAIAIAFFLGYFVNHSLTCKANFLHAKSAKALLKQMKCLLTSNFPTVVLLGLMLSATWPFFTGNIGGELRPIHFPDHYAELDNWLRAQEGDFRVAYLPPACWATDYSWASNRFLDPIAALPAQPTIELKSERDLTLAGNFVRWVYTSIYNNRTAYWGKLLGLMGVKYVIVREDADLGPRDDLKHFNLQNTLRILPNMQDLILEKRLESILVYSNPYYLPHIFSVEGISLIAGDRRTLITLSYFPSFNFSEHSVAFVDNGASISKMLPHLKSVVLDGDRYWDLIISCFDERYIIKPWNYVKPSTNERIQWIKGDFSWYFYDGNMHVAPDNYIMANGNNSITLPFMIQKPDLYKVLVQVFETPHPDFQGIKFKVDNVNEEVCIYTRSPRLEGSFKWVPIADYNLDAGPHSILITSLGGAAAISKIAVVPNSSISSMERNLLKSIDASNTSSIYLFDDYTWSFNSTSEPQKSVNSSYSNGQAVKLSNGRINVDFYVFKSGNYVPSIRILKNENETSALRINIDDFSTVLNASLDSSASFRQLKPIRLEQGYHSMSLTNHESSSSFVVDYITLHYVGSSGDINMPQLCSGQVSSVKYIRRSGSLYEVYPEDSFLIFLEAHTKYWQLQSGGWKVTPFIIFGYANAFQLNKNFKHKCDLIYLGLSYIRQGSIISVFLTIAVLVMIRYISSHHLKASRLFDS